MQPLYDAVLERIGVGHGTELLDAGCGSGLAAQLAARRGAIVTGLDATPELLAIARRRVPNGEFLEGDLESLPFADGAFDAVVGFNSFQYAATPQTALAEAKRVVRQGAPVVIATWAVPERCEAAVYLAALKPLMPPAPEGAPGPFALSAPGALEELATAAGLTPGDADEVASPLGLLRRRVGAARPTGRPGRPSRRSRPRANRPSATPCWGRSHRSPMAPADTASARRSATW